jgi:hypothetical protein
MDDPPLQPIKINTAMGAILHPATRTVSLHPSSADRFACAILLRIPARLSGTAQMRAIVASNGSIPYKEDTWAFRLGDFFGFFGA